MSKEKTIVPFVEVLHGTTTVLWHPEGTPTYSPCVIGAAHGAVYGRTESGVWWRLSDGIGCGPQRFRTPAVKVQDQERISEFNCILETGRSTTPPPSRREG